MKSEYSFSSTLMVGVRELVAILCIGALVPGNAFAQSQQAPSATAPVEQSAAKLPPDQLDSLVAPIALYPDPLLSQDAGRLHVSSRSRSAEAVVGAAQET